MFRVLAMGKEHLSSDDYAAAKVMGGLVPPRILRWQAWVWVEKREILCFFQWNKLAETYLPQRLWIPHLASFIYFSLESSAGVVWSSGVMGSWIWTEWRKQFLPIRICLGKLEFQLSFSFSFWQQTLMLEDTLPLISGKHQIFVFYLWDSDRISFKLFL